MVRSEIDRSKYVKREPAIVKLNDLKPEYDPSVVVSYDLPMKNS